MSWTKGGGPNQLRLKEQELTKACDAGSMPACEERYCRDGVSEECRQRVLLVAPMSGENWYLRDQDRPAVENGFANYSVRCTRRGAREFRDVQVRCSTTAGPNRCLSARTQQAFPRLDLAASSSCHRARSQTTASRDSSRCTFGKLRLIAGDSSSES